MTKERDERGTLAATEYHPAADSAKRWVYSLGAEELLRIQEAFASTALSGNRLSDVCCETLRRLMSGEPVSDRYLLGLAWTMRELLELRKEAK